VSVYAGPEGSTTETDPGVQPIGVTAAVAAGTVVTEPLHLTLADGTMARALIEGSIQMQRPFVVIFVASPRLESGDPVPGGALAACHLNDGSVEKGAHLHACEPDDHHKTTICHIPPGNPANAHTLCIGNAAVPAHLENHGDHLGACQQEQPCPPPGATSGSDG